MSRKMEGPDFIAMEIYDRHILENAGSLNPSGQYRILFKKMGRRLPGWYSLNVFNTLFPQPGRPIVDGSLSSVCLLL